MRTITICLLLAVTTHANAAITKNLGGKTYEFLEFSYTEGMNRYEVEAAIADPNSELYGYNFASAELTEALLLSYGPFDGVNGLHGDPAAVNGAAAFLNDFGIVFAEYGAGYGGLLTTVDGYSLPYVNDFSSPFHYGVASSDPCGWGALGFTTCQGKVNYISDFSDTPVMAYQFAYEGWDADSAYGVSPYNVMPSLLVTVPVPAAVWLFASALAALWVRARTRIFS